MRPKLRLKFIPCYAEERDCEDNPVENTAAVKAWLESSTLVLYYNTQSLDAENGSIHSRAMLDFSSITQNSLYNFDISLKSLSPDPGFLTSRKATDSFISLAKLGVQSSDSKDTSPGINKESHQLIAIDFTVSPTLTLYEVRDNSFIDLVIAFGGISISCFILGQVLVDLEGRKEFVRYLLGSLFQIQDVHQVQ